MSAPLDEIARAERELDPAWGVLGGRVATGSAAFFALVTLLCDGSVLRAVLHGAGTLVAIGLVWRVGLFALERSLPIASEPEEADEGAPS